MKALPKPLLLGGVVNAIGVVPNGYPGRRYCGRRICKRERCRAMNSSMPQAMQAGMATILKNGDFGSMCMSVPHVSVIGRVARYAPHVTTSCQRVVKLSQGGDFAA